MRFSYLLTIFVIAQNVFCLQRFADFAEIPENSEIYALFRDEAESSEVFESEEDLVLQQKPVVICLGQSCYALLKIRECGLRGLAYPFDWNVTYHAALITLINNDFSQLMDEHLIHFDNHTRIWNELYGGGVDLQQGFTLCHICSAQATKENFLTQFFPALKERM
jgi:hypothetical protein